MLKVVAGKQHVQATLRSARRHLPLRRSARPREPPRMFREASSLSIPGGKGHICPSKLHPTDAVTSTGYTRTRSSGLGLRAAASISGHVVLTQARLDQLLEAEITALALRDPRPMTLQSLLNSTKNARELAILLHDELPVRYAQRIKMLESLPAWDKRGSITHVRQMYVISFKELRLADPNQPEVFQQQLMTIKKRHLHTNLLVGGFKNYAQMEELGERDINEWLDRFFVLRVSTNMLISQYLEMANGVTSTGACNPYQSSIDPLCDPRFIARHAADVIGKLSKQWYGCAPEIQVVADGAQPFPFVPRSVQRLSSTGVSAWPQYRSSSAAGRTC